MFYIFKRLKIRYVAFEIKICSLQELHLPFENGYIWFKWLVTSLDCVQLIEKTSSFLKSFAWHKPWLQRPAYLKGFKTRLDTSLVYTANKLSDKIFQILSKSGTRFTIIFEFLILGWGSLTTETSLQFNTLTTIVVRKAILVSLK